VADEHPPDVASAGTPPPGEPEPPVPAEPGEEVAVPSVREQQPDKEPQAVADEHPPDSTSAGPPPAGEQGPPVTEKPVATRRPISHYVVSVDDTTGSIVKIEKLDEQTGERKRLTQADYVAAYGRAASAAPPYAANAASLYRSLSSPVMEAYVKVIADYIKAFTGQR